MKFAAQFFLLLLFGVAGAAAADKEAVIPVFDQRKIGLTVPAGFTLDHTEDPARGIAVVKISGPKGTIELNIVFTPDATDGELACSTELATNS